MSKKKKKKLSLEDLNNIKIRDWNAVAAHFRNSAGAMKDPKKDKKIDRQNARKSEKNLGSDCLVLN